MFDPKTSHFTQFDTLTPKSTPLFLLPDSHNNIWFTESTANKLAELSYPDYKMTEYTLPTSESGPVEITFGQNQSVIWITESFAGKIASFDVSSHNFEEFTPPVSVSLKSPVGIVTDPSGNVWVSEHGGSAVVELIPSNSTFKLIPPQFRTTNFLFLQSPLLQSIHRGDCGLSSILRTRLVGSIQ